MRRSSEQFNADKEVDSSQLKVRQNVVAEAYGDSYDDLLALDVRIVRTIVRLRKAPVTAH